MTWSPPETVAEFKIVRPIGAGAMGRVFLAQDTLLGRTVAIKFIGAAEVSDHARERFYREARAIARLDHPNVVGIHRVGEFRQRPYLVSEYVEGESLDRIPKPVPWSRVVAIAIGTARGLAAAHRRDVLHRDIKPANIMLGGDDAAKLLDFGLASIVGAEDMKASAPQDLAVAATSPGDPAATTSAAGRVAPMKRDHVDEGEPLIGTPLYFAPELWHGQPASIASDIYAFGLVLYELLAGRVPGTGRSLGELRAAASEPVIDLESLVPGVPTALLQLVMSCVDRDPARRPATVDALLEQLELLRTPLGTDSPYRGLLAFQTEQRTLFFGRNQDIGAIVDRLRRDSFVVVAGDSGVGKSSLCRAGVLPTFIDQEGSRWRVRVVTPGARPLEVFDELAAMREPTVVFVDQLEELVTLSPADQRELAARRLVELAADPTKCRVLATARNDFLGRLAELDALGELLSRSLVLIGPLSERGLREAVTAPAKLAGYQFSPELIDELVASGRRSLPLLQFALNELWDGRDETSKRISLAALAAIGGVGGALARHADRVMASFNEGDHEHAWGMLLRLVTSDGTRASVPLASLVDLAATREDGERVIERLVQARLIVVQPDDERRVEVAHEALFSRWPRLLEWRRAHDHDARYRDRVVEAAAHWRERGRPRGLLWRGNALGEYRAWRTRWREPLGPFEREFGDASETDARHGRRIAFAIVALVVLGLTTGLVLLYRADRRTEAQKRALFADQAATERADRYDQRALPYLLQLRREGEDSAALHLAIADATRDLQRATGLVVSAPKGTLATEWSPDGSWFVVVERGGRIQVVSDGAIKQVWSADRELNRPTIREDGTIAATDFDGVLWLWKVGVAQATSLPPRVAGHGAPAAVPYRTTAFEPGGTQIGALGPDGVMRIWNPTGQVAVLGRPGSQGTDVVATSDLIVACRADGHVQGWRWSDHARVIELPPEATSYCQLAVTPRGDVIAVTGNRLTVWGPDRATAPREQRYGDQLAMSLGSVRADRIALFDASGRVDVLELGTLRKVGSVGRPTNSGLRSVELSPDGRRVVTSGVDGFFRIWDLENRFEQITFASNPYGGTSSHAPQAAFASRFSRDGRRLLTMSGVDVQLWRIDDDWPVVDQPACPCKSSFAARWSRDETAIVATGPDIAVILDGGRIVPVRPPPIRGWDVTWSADGAHVLIVGDGGYAKVFARDGSLVHDLPGHRGTVNHAATSPDGRWFATACSDHLVRVFDVVTGTLIHSFDVGAPATSVAWSPDGERLAAAGYDGSIPIWEVATEKLEQRLVDPSTQFLDLTFDPSGTRVATAGQDSVVRVWTLSDGTYRELLGHRGPVTSIAWSPDGGLLASSAEAYGIRIWDPESGREVAGRDLGTSFLSVEWSRDGSRLLAAANGRGVLVLDARHAPQPTEELERLVEAGPWTLEGGQLVRKQR